MLQRPPACNGCPANATARGFAPPSGPKNAVLALIGQGPGADEATFGEPFIGESGRSLSRWCVRADAPRDKCAISNVVWCQLPGNRAPKVAEAQHCWRAHVRPWLESLTELRVVVAIGVPAMQVFLGRKASASIAGTTHNVTLPWPGDPYARKNDDLRDMPQADSESPGRLPDVQREAGREVPPATTGAGTDVDSVRGSNGSSGWSEHPAVRRAVTIVPILHPAYIMRGQFASEPSQIDFLRRAWRIAHGDEPATVVDATAPPPGCIPTPTLEDLRKYLLSTTPTDVLACDIEGAGGRLIGIGFARLRDEATIYIPVLDAEKPYWSDDEWPAADEVMRCLLCHPLVFHNGQAFDIPFLESCGYAVEQYADDTMIRHHTLYAEQPKSLEELAIRYLGFPSWKWLSKVESGEQK